MSNQWDFVVETLEDSDCDDLDIDLIFESKDILGASKLKFDKIFIKNDCSGGVYFFARSKIDRWLSTNNCENILHLPILKRKKLVK